MAVGESITVTVPGVPSGGDDEQGNPELGPATVTAVFIRGFSPERSVESAQEPGVFVTSPATVYGYRGTVIPPNAVLTIRGQDYVMDGEVGDWLSGYPSSVAKGVEFAVKRAS